jgi:shikimate kinase
MKFVIIIGPQAVGKMTVGQELEKITDLKLFHNHMTIELVHPFVSFGTDKGRKIVRDFRDRLFREIAESNLEGLIFTFICNFEDKDDWEYIEEISSIFKDKDGEVYLVELEADLEERLRRNKTENRLHHKPTKRDIEFSEGILKKSLEKGRFNSNEGEIKVENYKRIDNTDTGPELVARQIKGNFSL